MLASATLPSVAIPVTQDATISSGSASVSPNQGSVSASDDTQTGNFRHLLNNTQNTAPATTAASRSNTPSDAAKATGDKTGGKVKANATTPSSAPSPAITTANNADTSDADLITALQQNLQALLALTQNNAKGDSSATDATTTTTKDGKTTSSNDTAIAAILAQLNVLYQQLVNAQATAGSQTPQIVATTGNTVQDSLSVDVNPDGTAANQGMNQKLLDLLTASAGNAGNAQPAGDNSGADAKLAALASNLLANIQQANATIDPGILKNFLKQAQAVVSPPAVASSVPADALPKVQVDQTAVITLGIFAQNDKSGSGDTNSDGSQSDSKDNNADKNNANTIGNSNIQTGSLQQPTHIDTGFGKLVASVSPQASLSPADQVSVQIKNAAATGASQITVQLNPDNLGKVDVQLVTDSQGKVNITISSDSRNTLALLQNDAKSLQNALQDIGMKTNNDGLSFNLRDGQQQQGRNTQNQGKFTKVDAVGEVDGSSSGTLIAGYSSGYNNSEYIQNYQLSLQKGVDIRI